jgi:translocation and assembly module TamA
VRLDPVTSSNEATVTAPVRVTVIERAAHRISFGIGASSNTGARAQVSYLYPDLFGRALDFAAGVKYEETRQTVFGDVFLPRRQADTQDSVGAQYEHEDIENLDTTTQTWRTTRSVSEHRSERRYTLTFEYSTEISDLDEKTVQALAPSISQTWRRVDSLIKPRRGGNYFVEIAGASNELLSDTSFLYTTAQAQYFVPLSDDLVLLLHGELGATFADDVDDVPLRYLFRTGGSGSVRGFDYLSIGEQEGESVVGAKRLLVLSAELNYWFTDSWGAALFLDAGNAKNQLEDLVLDNYGYGLGLRYATPAGPFALDVARGSGDDDTRIHFAITIPF